MPIPSERSLSPYGSARDLPSLQEMSLLMSGGKLLTRFIARHQRAEFLQIEAELNHFVAVVDRFYDRLGPRHWIFHEWLDFSAVEEILDQATTPEEAELRLIETYRDEDDWTHRTRSLYRFEGLRERAHQIERAREHYFADQFDSATLHLIAVMDGFVNDFEPEKRRGLASRDPDSMVAWNSIVGHHLGLTNALNAYRKTFKRRVDEEVYELHRHGIVHGTITRFDNVVVATKAWNMLFALGDWARATTKARQPETPKPTWREAIRRLREMETLAELAKRAESWKPSRLSVSDAGFEDHEIYALTVEFLTAWRECNYGALAHFPCRQFEDREISHGQMAGQLRRIFDVFDLSEFRVTELENTAPVIWLSRGEATVNEWPGTFECRWILEEPDGTHGWYGSDSAVWRLRFCGPTVWRRSERE